MVTVDRYRYIPHIPESSRRKIICIHFYKIHALSTRQEVKIDKLICYSVSVIFMK